MTVDGIRWDAIDEDVSFESFLYEEPEPTGLARIFKEQKLWLKTKEPVLIIPMQNALDLENVNLDYKQIENEETEEVF